MTLLTVLVSALIQWLITLVRPGVEINVRELPPPRSGPTDTGVWFVVGITEKGPIGPTLISSLSEFEAKYGTRVSYGTLYDAVDVFFREGGRRVYVSRVLGPAPTLATRNLLDAGAATSLVANAANPGAWGASVSVEVAAGSTGGTFVIKTYLGGVLKETSPDLVDTAAAVQWGANSDYIRLVQGASVNDPAVVAPTALVGGNDDRINITDTQWQTALDSFTKDLGPGQVSAPGRTTSNGHGQLLNHAASNYRTALLDLPDSGTKATLITAADAARAYAPRYGGAFAPWYVVPGVVQQTTRTVPPSAVIAGIIARNDITHTANRAAAGELGQSLYALRLSQPAWTDLDRQDLNNKGVNVSVVKFGSLRNYGWRTLADPLNDPGWTMLGNPRMIMQIVAQALTIMERHLFDEIDGRGRLFAAVQGELTAMLQPFYDAGSLYGATPAEAFFVDTGPQVNTTTTIANNELHAAVSLRLSPTGELVVLDLVKVMANQAIA